MFYLIKYHTNTFKKNTLLLNLIFMFDNNREVKILTKSFYNINFKEIVNFMSFII